MYSTLLSFQLVEWDKNFEICKQKFLYIEIWSVATSPDGKSVMTVRDNDVMINDIEMNFTREEFRQTLAVKGSVAGRAPVVVDDQTIACVERSSGLNVSLYEYDNGKFPAKGSLKDGHDMIINALLINGNSLVSAGWDSKIVLWDIKALQKKQEFGCESYINTLCWADKDKKQVLAGGKNEYLIWVQL